MDGHEGFVSVFTGKDSCKFVHFCHSDTLVYYILMLLMLHFCPVKVVLLAPCELACLWILMALMRHCILGTLSTFSVCPRLSLVLGPVLVCISGLLVHMFWALSLLFTHVDCLMVCWYVSCVFVLVAIICVSILGVGFRPSFRILNAHVCGVAPQ